MLPVSALISDLREWVSITTRGRGSFAPNMYIFAYLLMQTELACVGVCSNELPSWHLACGRKGVWIAHLYAWDVFLLTLCFLFSLVIVFFRRSPLYLGDRFLEFRNVKEGVDRITFMGHVSLCVDISETASPVGGKGWNGLPRGGKTPPWSW